MPTGNRDEIFSYVEDVLTEVHDGEVLQDTDAIYAIADYLFEEDLLETVDIAPDKSVGKILIVHLHGFYKSLKIDA